MMRITKLCGSLITGQLVPSAAQSPEDTVLYTPVSPGAAASHELAGHGLRRYVHLSQAEPKHTDPAG